MPGASHASPLRVRAAGEGAILIEAGSADAVRAVTDWVHHHRLRDTLGEVIPAMETVFLAGDASTLAMISAEIVRLGTLEHTPAASTGKRIVVEVRYDGQDLPEVAERLGLTVAEVIDIHSGTDYPVEFFGFAPGQAFFGGLSPRLRLPRRPSPRTLVPAGALAIANAFTVIYPQHSPGGWNLIGTRLSEPLWDLRQNPPNLLEVGDVVRFRACP